MKKVLQLFICTIFLFSLVFGEQSLSDAYQAAQPGNGYDKLLILNPAETYTGGLTITNQKVCIIGNGALIDLQNGSIAVFGDSQIDLDGCTIVNGTNALSVEPVANVSSIINQCTFYDNAIAIRFMSETGSIEVVNTIISNSSTYGFACSHGTTKILHYIDIYSSGIPYVEWCPG
ncbi:MAG: right-handed parallel beta-helix repeat-containing protein [Calditrichia bacterium]|nr:right-handed parallel beta-helix repeat-containing protein [Calditrichia bacterium]